MKVFIGVMVLVVALALWAHVPTTQIGEQLYEALALGGLLLAFSEVPAAKRS